VARGVAPEGEGSERPTPATDDERLVPLRDLVTIVRSKNAGPFRLTLDMLFKDEATYRLVKASGVITLERIAQLYGIRPDQITTFVEFDPGRAIKATFVRPLSSGSIGDGDVYGAQQHAPLLDLLIPMGADAGRSSQ
jgi:hypothetical protein